jgi:hypothetical protein
MVANLVGVCVCVCMCVGDGWSVHLSAVKGSSSRSDAANQLVRRVCHRQAAAGGHKQDWRRWRIIGL